MSGGNAFEPRIVAYVCNWCTYLGADLAGTARLEYPPNVRIIRLPCTGRIDTNLVVKAFEIGADAVLVSGCHPGDCHYTAGNYHARRRWMLFRELLDVVGFDMRRIHFSWISAAEGRKFQQVIVDITESTRKLGPYRLYDAPAPSCKGIIEPSSLAGGSACPTLLVNGAGFGIQETRLREAAAKLLGEGTVKVVIGYGERGPAFVTKAEDVSRLVWNERCLSNLATYLKRKEVRALGKPAIVVKGCDERALVVLEKESQVDRQAIHVIGMECGGMAQPKCAACDTVQARFADQTIAGDGAERAPAADRYAALDALLAKPPEERLAFWTAEFDRCLKCYACRQVCPMCYCEQCIADKNRPQAIDTSAHRKGNFAWHLTRAIHLAGRCVGCDECTRACPAGIDLRLLNSALARAAESKFGYRAGTDPAVELLTGAYSLQDKEEFIR